VSTTARSASGEVVARPPVRGYFASVTLRIEDVRPEVILDSPPSGVRGFWQSGPHWIAYVGSAAEIDGRTWPGRGPAGSVPDVFGRVEAEAERLFAEPWTLDLDGEGRRPRLHGGFAFDLTRPRTDGDPGFWEPYPVARFVLPAIEVEADGTGARLTVTRRFEHGTSRDRAVDELRRRAGRVREALCEVERSGATPGPVPAATAIEEPVGPDQWRGAIDRILVEIARGAIRKVVLARPLDVTLAGAPDAAAVLAALRSNNPLAHTFLIQFERDRFFLGAAPELIGALEGRRFRTMAVAGSTPRGADPESDEWLGRQLLSSRKNLVEQRIVVEDIAEHLAMPGTTVVEIPDPELLRLPRIQHLRTVLVAEVAEDAHVLGLVRALHPTAAVCGYPREAARDILREEEPIERGWYAGPVGWFDDRGNGEFAPALRSAVGRGPRLRLYAGAGIVEGSRPRAEWDETRVKFQTMFHALDISRVP